VYVPALDGTGLIALDSEARSRYLYGASYSGGIDSNVNELKDGASSGVFLFSPFLGIQGNGQRVQYVVQYQPTFRQYTQNQYAGGSLQLASATVTGIVNERWSWEFNTMGSHGQDSIRLLAPSQSVAVGDVPGTGSSSASFRPNAGTITYINGAAGMTLKASERSSVAFGLSNYFSQYSDLGGYSNVATATVAYTHSVTPKFQWLDYGQTARYYGSIHCYSYGGGLGVEWKPAEHAYLHLSGGPQVDTSGCGQQQAFTYHVEFSSRPTNQTQFYVTASRDIASSYLGPGLWQQTVAVGYQHDFDRYQSIATDFGYVNATGLQGVSSYSGTYVDGIYNRRFGRSFNAEASFRHYAGDLTTQSFTRDTALFSISWRPSAGHIFQ
jgi:hypothetical protein